MVSLRSQLLYLVGFGLLILQQCAARGLGVIHDKSWKPDYVLVATARNVNINCESRYSVVFNGTYPGPALHMVAGKTTWVRVWNGMKDNNLTVHWHGLSQRTAPFSDGTPQVSQWPIAPFHFFDYELRPEATDAGTYMYHSHVGLQALTAHGLIVVHEADGKSPYQYDEDIPLLFSDYFPKQDSVLEAGLVANPFQWSGEPFAITINGQSGNASFTEGADKSCKPYILDVEPGKTYRLRLVSATALSFIMFGLEDHGNLTIIEADGQYTKPAGTERIQISSGQRFSILFTAKSQQELASQNKTSFWLRYENRDRPTSVTGYGLVRYKTGFNATDTNSTACLPAHLPNSPPVHLPNQLQDYTDWLEYSLEALNPQSSFPTLSEVTRTVYIQVNQKVVNGFYNGSVQGQLQWDANGLTWSDISPDMQSLTPYLVSAYTGTTPDYDAAMNNNGWDPKTRAWPARVGEVLDIVWLSNSGPTGGYDSHPMHAHGVHYWDLGSGNGSYNAEENEKKFASYTPALRDTTQLYRYSVKGSANVTSGWRAWRVRVTEDNVGAWIMHCHILPHMAMGMQTVWVFGDAGEIVREIPQPYVSGYLQYGGSAYGNQSYDPLVVQYFD